MFKIILNKIKSEIATVISISILLGFAIVFFYKNTKRVEIQKTKENILYTTAKLTDFKKGYKTIGNLYFEYIDDKGILKESSTFPPHLIRNKPYSFFKNNYLGKSYLMQFSTEYSWYTELFLDYPVPDSLVNCKDCFWKEKPRRPRTLTFKVNVNGKYLKKDN